MWEVRRHSCGAAGKGEVVGPRVQERRDRNVQKDWGTITELDMEGKTETEKGRNSRGNSIGKGGIDKQVYGVSLGLGWVGVARCEPKAFI